MTLIYKVFIRFIMSRVIISVVSKSRDSFSIVANDGESSLQMDCKENYIFWNLLKIKLKFLFTSIQRRILNGGI